MDRNYKKTSSNPAAVYRSFKMSCVLPSVRIHSPNSSPLHHVDRFLHSSQDLFASTDTAYILAFSIIMLTTDLHCSHVKVRKKTDSSSALPTCTAQGAFIC